MDNINYGAFGGEVENKNEDYSKFGGEVEQEIAEKPRQIKTLLGELPSPENAPQFKIGTPENKELIKEMIDWTASTPGLNVIGKGISKSGSLLGNLFKKAFKSSSPYEEKLYKANKGLEQAEKESSLPKIGSLIEQPTTEIEKIENTLGKYLNIEGAHDINAARSLTHRANSIEKYWNDSYKQFENKIRDVQFKMPKELTIIKESKKVNNPYYKHLLNKAPKSTDTNAADFIAKYRDFRDALGSLKSDLKSENIGSLEKSKIADALKEIKDMEIKIKDVLNKGLGEFKPEWDWVNKGYSEHIYPLRNNPVIKNAKKGKLSSNIINDLRTNESGMPLVREIVKQDPELLRNILGQRYRIKPNELHNPTETIREYLEETPELKSLLKQKKNLLKETAKRKDIALKNKIEAEDELNRILGQTKKARKDLTYTGLGLTLSGVPGVSYLGKLLSKEALGE